MDLGPLTVLVGPNGSGKSNFLDTSAIHDRCTVDDIGSRHADRGGVRRSPQTLRRPSEPFLASVRLSALAVAARSPGIQDWGDWDGGFRVTDEECVVVSDDVDVPDAKYRVHNGAVTTTSEVSLPPAAEDRLYLVSASSIQPFRAVFSLTFTGMGLNLNPSAVRTLQSPDPGVLLRRGSNLARARSPRQVMAIGGIERITEYLQRVAPGVVGVTRRSIGSMERRSSFASRSQARPRAGDSPRPTCRMAPFVVLVYSQPFCR